MYTHCSINADAVGKAKDFAKTLGLAGQPVLAMWWLLDNLSRLAEERREPKPLGTDAFHAIEGQLFQAMGTEDGFNPPRNGTAAEDDIVMFTYVGWTSERREGLKFLIERTDTPKAIRVELAMPKSGTHIWWVTAVAARHG